MLTADGVTLTGTAAIGTTINVYGPDNSLIGTGVTGPDGTFSVVLTPAQTNGQSLEVTANTALGGASLPTEITAGDTSAPAPLSDLAVNASGTLVTGRGEVGASVTITGAGGVVLGNATVGANGTFSAQLNAPQVNGQVLNATQTDASNNTSSGLNVTAPDITPRPLRRRWYSAVPAWCSAGSVKPAPPSPYAVSAVRYWARRRWRAMARSR
ncbi:Ig-like domain-containing protein [Pseudomonas sp. B24_DOA]|nr:Ig-like domain-containing protein [Pseudomonas sp. B24_DOA]WKV87291.1 Ig-like domain-containing protein [Pseudomonas sp. B21_DOA]